MVEVYLAFPAKWTILAHAVQLGTHLFKHITSTMRPMLTMCGLASFTEASCSTCIIHRKHSFQSTRRSYMSMSVTSTHTHTPSSYSSRRNTPQTTSPRLKASSHTCARTHTHPYTHTNPLSVIDPTVWHKPPDSTSIGLPGRSSPAVKHTHTHTHKHTLSLSLSNSLLIFLSVTDLTI